MHYQPTAKGLLDKLKGFPDEDGPWSAKSVLDEIREKDEDLCHIMEFCLNRPAIYQVAPDVSTFRDSRRGIDDEALTGVMGEWDRLMVEDEALADCCGVGDRTRESALPGLDSAFVKLVGSERMRETVQSIYVGSPLHRRMWDGNFFFNVNLVFLRMTEPGSKESAVTMMGFTDYEDGDEPSIYVTDLEFYWNGLDSIPEYDINVLEAGVLYSNYTLA